MVLKKKNIIKMRHAFEAQTKSGKGRGKKMGFPTLNLAIPKNFPYAYGIFAGWLTFDNKKYKAAIHYGPIPTFKEKTPALEIYAIKAKITTPPKIVTFKITHYLREIREFENTKDLADQITADVKKIEKLLSEKNL